MIVTDKFVFVHLPRSGGTFICELIRKFFPSAREIGHHMPRKLLPQKYSHLPVLGTIRNPWDFYVSFYHYVQSKSAASTFLAWMRENSTADFRGSIRNILNLTTDEQRLDKLLSLLPEQVDYSRTQIPNVSKHTLEKVRGSGVGYYTFRFNELFGNPDDVSICRLETLREDLLSFFEALDLMTDQLRNYVLCSDKKNAAEHSHYSTYYSSELAELVSIRDRQLIERFRYVYEQPCSVHAAAAIHSR